MTARPRLSAARVVLVPQTLDAAKALLEGTDVGLPLGEGYPHADTLDALRMYVEHAGPDDGGDFSGGWFVTLVEDGRIVGDCGTFGPPDDQGRVEIGYGLAVPFRGRGYGTEAVRALVDWLVAHPDVRMVTASVEVGNEPSRRLLHTLRFTLASQADGHWHFERS